MLSRPGLGDRMREHHKGDDDTRHGYLMLFRKMLSEIEAYERGPGRDGDTRLFINQKTDSSY